MVVSILRSSFSSPLSSSLRRFALHGLGFAAAALPALAQGTTLMTCPGNVVTNGDFTAGFVPGSMPSGAASNWSLLTNSPQVVQDGCRQFGALQMWGNGVVGESVSQALTTPIVAGRTYRVSLCYRWLDNNPILPQYVRFRLCASGGTPAAYPPTSSYDVIGTTPNTSSTFWTSHVFADWTAPNNAAFLTINPENDSTINHGDFVSWGLIDDICIQEVDTCKGNIVRNSRFTSGLVPGSMPGGSVANWSLLTASPQVVAGDGCTDDGAIQMWGNQVVGESVRQQLATPILAGKTYSITVCYRWMDDNPTLPPYVKFRLAATNSLPTTYPATSSYDLIGITPATSSTAWTTYTFPKWRAPNDAAYLTINPENDFAINDGAFVSWGRIDNICIVECCKNNMVRNADFTDGLVAGSMPAATAANWSLLTASPQVVPTEGCAHPGTIQMWGNQVVGESVQQTLGTPIIAGRKYRVSLCYRWLDANPSLPNHVRFQVCVSGAAPAAYPPSTYMVIGETPNTYTTNWVTHTFPEWTAPAGASFLTINPRNDFAVNDGAFVSWGQIDDICIQDVTRISVATPYGTGCVLTQAAATPSLGLPLEFTVFNIPAGTLAGAEMIGLVQRPGLPLDIIGMNGCELLVNPSFVTRQFHVTGDRATVEIDTPNDPNLIGVEIGVQALTVSPGVNALGVAASNGMMLTLGM